MFLLGCGKILIKLHTGEIWLQRNYFLSTVQKGSEATSTPRKFRKDCKDHCQFLFDLS